MPDGRPRLAQLDRVQLLNTLRPGWVADFSIRVFFLIFLAFDRCHIAGHGRVLTARRVEILAENSWFVPVRPVSRTVERQRLALVLSRIGTV
jgi:hypothetical protein